MGVDEAWPGDSGSHTGRFSEPGELVGTLIQPCFPAASFVNGVVVPVDGGFSVFGGV